jgi:predicted MFS family arabinose efflux permease
VVDACTSLLAALMIYFFFPDQKLATTQKTAVLQGQTSTSAYKDTFYLVFVLLVSMFAVCFMQLFASIPQYFSKACNYSEAEIGLLLGLNGVLVVLIEMPLVTTLEKNKKMFPYIITGALLLPAAFMMLHFGKGIMLMAFGYTFLMTMSEIMCMPFMFNYALSRPPKDRQGQYSALYMISFSIANIFAPLLGLGIAGRYGFGTMFYCFTGLSLITALGFMLLQKKHGAEVAK